MSSIKTNIVPVSAHEVLIKTSKFGLDNRNTLLSRVLTGRDEATNQRRLQILNTWCAKSDIKIKHVDEVVRELFSMAKELNCTAANWQKGFSGLLTSRTHLPQNLIHEVCGTRPPDEVALELMANIVSGKNFLPGTTTDQVLTLTAIVAPMDISNGFKTDVLEFGSKILLMLSSDDNREEELIQDILDLLQYRLQNCDTVEVEENIPSAANIDAAGKVDVGDQGHLTVEA